MSEEQKKEDFKWWYIPLAVVILAGFVGFICLIIKAAERNEEIQAVEEVERAYNHERNEYQLRLMDEISDCQRQDESGWKKNNCEARRIETGKIYEQLEQHRIELNYRIRKLWPK